MGLGQLFLLSTGEEKDLEVVRGWVQAEVAKQKDVKDLNTIPWRSGYGGIGLCEYYLRTGDAAVIPLIEKHADYLKRNMYNGGWNQFGGVNYSYGHLNAAGIPATTFLLLAKECGAQVDEHTLQESFKHFYRMAGHGNVAYGNNMPDSGFVDNGKVGKMAFFMAAAASLTPEGEKSVYAKARDISAVRSFYSTSWMFHGHTGGGIGEIWRGASMGLMADKKPLKFREFMDNRQWFYELSRHYDGSMGIVGNYHGGGGYDDPNSWGIGITLAYTIPRKTLRITGAPPSKFAKPYQLPKRPWGTEADEAFFSMTPAPDKNGKVQDWDSERLATDASWPILRKINDPNATDETLLMYARHPDQGVREMSALVISKRSKAPLILELLKDKDPRARQAGLMAASSPALLSDEVAELLISMINDPNESWWVVIHALNRLGMVNPELLVPHIDRLCHWAQHEEWWLQKAALTALTGLATDERFYQKLLPLIGEVATTNRVADIMGPVRAITAKANGAKPEVKTLAAKVFGQAYAEFPKKLSAPGGLDLGLRNTVPGPVTFLESELAANLASLPGGLEVLYTLGKERFPEQSLPHRDLFLGAPAEQLGSKVTGALKPAILNNLIPEHVGKNWKSLSALAKAEMKAANHPGGRVDVMDQLADLYRRAGDTTDYSWHTFGPDRLQDEWAYFTFDPPEKKLWDGTGRFRPVTVPAEMTQWFAKDFDPAKAAWKKGRAPFVNVGGKLQAGICKGSPCACGDAPGTLWDKEVLLMRRSFDLPPMKPGHRYRLVVGGTSHVGAGEGWTVYVNGRQMAEAKTAFGRNSGGLPKGAFITSEWFDEFKNGGRMEVAAIAFLSARKDKQNNINIWFEEMKMPPFSDDQVRTWAANISLVSADWQSLQDPNRKADDPEAGKFKWDGKFVANPTLLGTWTTVAMVPSVDVFDSAKPLDANKAPFKEITFKEGGKTDDGLRMWTGDTLLDLGSGVYTPLQILKMTVKGDHLFIEAGGFSEKNPVGWKSPLVVMKRK